MNTHTTLTLAAVASAALISVGCGSKEPPENPQPFTPGQDAGAYPVNTYPTATATPTTTTTPTATPTTTSTVATPTVLDPAVQQILAGQVASIAQTDAKSMQKEGEMMSGILQEGQTLEQPVMLQPGKCYTVVGLGLPTIEELDIMIVPVIPLPNMPTLNVSLAQDLKTGAQATVAPAPSCYTQLIVPAQAKIVVKATRGSGPVAAQMYIK